MSESSHVAVVEMLVKKLGYPSFSGSYGSVWNVTMSTTWKRAITRVMLAATSTTVVSLPPMPSKIAIKIQQKNPSVSINEQRAMWDDETQAHESLHHVPSVPRLYLAATVGSHHVTVMQHVPGTPVEYLDEVKPGVYRSIEQTVRHMWKAGYAHADLHSYNVLVTRYDSVYIMHFGSTVRLPDRVRNEVMDMDDVDVDTVWDTVIGPCVPAASSWYTEYMIRE